MEIIYRAYNGKEFKENMGRCRYALEEYQEAIFYCEKALEIKKFKLYPTSFVKEGDFPKKSKKIKGHVFAPFES
tara:strand:+ start:869 stop:1090 length:222 start_codon:yes stop_codon:yes gene_type:complete